VGFCDRSPEFRYAPTRANDLKDLLTLPSGPGELKLGLDANNRTVLSLYRPAQQDLTVSIAENLVPAEVPDQIANFMQVAMVKPMVRRFDFASLRGISCDGPLGAAVC
jgi:hypothetical protein